MVCLAIFFFAFRCMCEDGYQTISMLRYTIVSDVYYLRTSHILVTKFSVDVVNDVDYTFSIFDNCICHIGYILKNNPVGF